MIYTDKIHLVGDSLQELHEFAQKIELNKCWFHNPRGKNHPHYDLTNSNHEPLFDKTGKKYLDKAIEYGARLVSDREVLKISKQLLSKNEFDFEKAITMVSVSNEMFKGSKPMEGEEYAILKEALKKSMKKTPTLKGRL